MLNKRVFGSKLKNTVNLISFSQENDRLRLGNHCLRERLKSAEKMFKKNLKSHFGCVNALELSYNGGEYLLSGGDDRRVLLWHLEKASKNSNYKPFVMKGQHDSNIFCVDFDCYNKTVFSGGNDDQVIVHDAETTEAKNVYLHRNPVYRISTHPSIDSLFLSAGDDGRVLMYDMRAPDSEDPFVLANYTKPFHGVAFNPAEPRLVATANSEDGVQLWDVRKPRSCLLRFGNLFSKRTAMSVCFDKSGRRLLALRRRLPAVVYDLCSEKHVAEFSHLGYFNSCTMKSGCFAGDRDEYVISGSDDHKVYVWKIPSQTELENDMKKSVTESHIVLNGHRSIVNQVRFNDHDHTIYSCGVEKIIKLWSLFQIDPLNEKLENEDRTRNAYSHQEYIDLILESRDSFINHDYTAECTEEDPRMMAFFDSLVQRELDEDSNSSDDGDDDDDDHDVKMSILFQECISTSSNNEEISEEDYLSDQNDAESHSTSERKISSFTSDDETVESSEKIESFEEENDGGKRSSEEPEDGKEDKEAEEEKQEGKEESDKEIENKKENNFKINQKYSDRRESLEEFRGKEMKNEQREEKLNSENSQFEWKEESEYDSEENSNESPNKIVRERRKKNQTSISEEEDKGEEEIASSDDGEISNYDLASVYGVLKQKRTISDIICEKQLSKAIELNYMASKSTVDKKVNDEKKNNCTAATSSSSKPKDSEKIGQRLANWNIDLKRKQNSSENESSDNETTKKNGSLGKKNNKKDTVFRKRQRISKFIRSIHLSSSDDENNEEKSQ